jgi:hypothetical protein
LNGRAHLTYELLKRNNLMKTTFKTFCSVILLSAIAVSPLAAQTNDPLATEKFEKIAETESEAPAIATNIAPAERNETVPAKPPKAPAPRAKEAMHFPSVGKSPSNWIPILAILAVFGMPVLIVGSFFYFRYRKTRLLHETLRLMVEKGTPIPPELLVASTTPGDGQPGYWDRRKRDDLRNGLILVGVGIGVTALAGKPGLIVLFIGVAMILASFMEKRTRSSESPEQK